MKKRKALFFVLAYFFLVMLANTAWCQDQDLLVRFNTPAEVFTEALPLGNGRIGALVFGGVKQDRIALNEISLWSGGPQDADSPDALPFLKPIQQYLLEGKNDSAAALMQKYFICRGPGSGHAIGGPIKFGCYQTFGDLLINWLDGKVSISGYNRILNLEQARTVFTHQRNGNTITQTVFADFKNDVIRVLISSARPGGLHFKVKLNRNENVISNRIQNSCIVLEGQLPSGEDKGMKYAAVLKMKNSGGKVVYGKDDITLENGQYCELIIGMRTNYNYKQGGLDSVTPASVAFTDVNSRNTGEFNGDLQLSTSKFQQFFNRCRWISPNKSNTATRTTQQRLADFVKGINDPELPVLYFNFGRYLLISSSRPGLLPANLQGLWAVEYQTPWNGDYHLDINVQMNYWPIEPLNLSDLGEPAFALLKKIVPNGEKTAKTYYGAEGWVAHPFTTPWFYTSPGEQASWGSVMTGGAWLTTHLWEHFLYTRDTAFLREYYPVIKGSAKFLQSVLIRENKHQWLVTAPSNSPENIFIMPNGVKTATCMGPTMDMQISRNIFEASSKAAHILNTDIDFAEDLERKIKELAPNQVSKRDGGIQEWLDDWPAEDPHHRHVSHLYGLYPYYEITPWDQPALAEAAKKTLELRGDGATGWSRALKICFWARLGDGNHAFKLFKHLMNPVGFAESLDGFNSEGYAGGSYPNLFDACPPFQIDGNFGTAAGLGEMLLQSHGKDQVIRFLPALPSAPEFESGKISGMKARGNYLVDIAWERHALTTASVKATYSGTCRVELNNKKVYDANGRPVVISIENGIASIPLIAGQKITIR